MTYLLPPVALSLMCRAVMPSNLHFSATSWAANIAAYGEASSLSAFTFIPPVIRAIVSLKQQVQGDHNLQLTLNRQSQLQQMTIFVTSLPIFDKNKL